jgi:hypothetical protein
MAGTSHATRRSHIGVIAVLVVAFLVVLTAVTLVVTSRDSGGSPSSPTPVAHPVAVARTVATCTRHRNGWYC